MRLVNWRKRRKRARERLIASLEHGNRRYTQVAKNFAMLGPPAGRRARDGYHPVGVKNVNEAIRELSCPRTRHFLPVPLTQRGVLAIWGACSIRGPHAAECLPRRPDVDPSRSVGSPA